MNNQELISMLPDECRNIKILPRHKVRLEHIVLADKTVWVVLLTRMPGDCPKAWKLTAKEYWKIQPKHGSRDRYIRENFPPTITTRRNPPNE